MKKFTKILVCLMLCVFGLGLVACDKRTEKEKAFTYPKSSDFVYGNGGLAVRKGDYVYFVNGYKQVSKLENSNKNDKYTVGSLMLMKLGENGELVTDEDGLIKDDYYISMSSKLCGYEATNLYIHGDYLYFVTPILENETGDEVWAKERVVLNRIKLNKKGDVEEVYRSNVKFDSLEFKYYENGNELYVLAWEKGQAYYDGNANNALVRINATNKSSSVVSEEVSSVVFADQMNEIFFVYDDEENYDVKKYDIATKTVTPFITDLENSVELKFVAGGKLYATQSHSVGSDSYSDLVVADYEAGNANFVLFFSNVGDYSISVTPMGEAIVLTKSNLINLVDANQSYNLSSGASITASVEESSDVTSIDIIEYTNGCILYHAKTSSNSIIKLVSYGSKLAGQNVEAETLTSVEAIESDYLYFDLNEDENCLYFYLKAGKSNNNYYLHRLQVNNNFGETEEMFGVYEADDEPEVEEDEEVEEEEE